MKILNSSYTIPEEKQGQNNYFVKNEFNSILFNQNNHYNFIPLKFNGSEFFPKIFEKKIKNFLKKEKVIGNVYFAII